MGRLWDRELKKQENELLDRSRKLVRQAGMSVKAILGEKLRREFAPAELEIVDESARHAGHAGARPEGETHFRVHIVSERFEGLSRVERQRRIHTALAHELATQIHALSLTALTPSEANKGI
jgi:BolA family transcriptional regulator, general stress-responsive regulator